MKIIIYLHCLKFLYVEFLLGMIEQNIFVITKHGWNSLTKRGKYLKLRP